MSLVPPGAAQIVPTLLGMSLAELGRPHPEGMTEVVTPRLAKINT